MAARTGDFELAAAHLLDALPYSRVLDLSRRLEAGHLTAAEALALAVLAGGANGESALGPLIDAATEEYGNGTYRVPVCVVGDKSRMLVVMTDPPGMSAAQSKKNADDVAQILSTRLGKGPLVFTIPVGSKLEVYEVGAASESRVEVKQGG